MSLNNFYEYLANLPGSSASLATFIIILIALLCLLAVPTLLSLILPLFHRLKDKRFKNFTFYLYAFSTGFFIALAMFGFLRESIEQSSHGAAAHFGDRNKSIIYGINIGTVVSGLIFGLLFSFALKFVITYRINKVLKKDRKLSVFVHDHGVEHHSHDHDHSSLVVYSHTNKKNDNTDSLLNAEQKISSSDVVIYSGDKYIHQHKHLNHTHSHAHPDYIFGQEENLAQAEETIINKTSPKMKVIALLLLLTHRIPEGILLGYNLTLATEGQTNNLTIAYFVSLILHLIPEESIFYFRLREAGFGRINSLLLSFLGLSLFLPFMLIGAYAGQYINELWWLKAIMFSAIAGIFLFIAIVEFIPEFYHNHMSKKQWFTVLVSLFIGIIIGVLILSFHSH
ncbi:ZIP family metal transporter [Mycoplasmopsis verecunda]|uniref:ZIP Zinc transporter n=1 Tax=Mycoplasmopsis verecunda TaxID=171291 RepID=A0A1T4LBH3_9BACT|nr:ZIP family metal transporter [Mycoplasmopsis verecunda]WPB54808.1 ZIP family metal transporter [Mycoplasmopsis verecunda]SJZ52119.1 ZIP Zinc transporter [Mycoplasmopsis verecunda]